LTGIKLPYHNLVGVNLAAQNLTNAYFVYAILTDANLSQADLTNAHFGYAELTGANFSGTEVRGASFLGYGAGGISIAQLYSTASYQAHDLTGIRLDGGNLAGVNLAGQNLTNAFFISSTLSGANLSGAEARGADFNLATLGGANTSNLIQSNGHIAGLDLMAGASLVVRDYDGNPYYGSGPIPISVDQHLEMDATGTLRMVFDADVWDSTISFAPGIPVTLGGTLELTFAADVNPVTQLGRTIDLFDWTGVTPTGTFTISSPYTWNLSNLYTTGEVTLATALNLPGDYNNNGTVDAADYVVWRENEGTSNPLPNDLIGGTIGAAHYNQWRAHFGQMAGSGAGANLNARVPEPTSCLLLLMALTAFWWHRRGRAG
jgi:hypothetical protein